MFPRLQGENIVSPVSATGLMMNLAFALHVEELSGQHEPDVVQPSAHYPEKVVRNSSGMRVKKTYVMLS